MLCRLYLAFTDQIQQDSMGMRYWETRATLQKWPVICDDEHTKDIIRRDKLKYNFEI